MSTFSRMSSAAAILSLVVGISGLAAPSPVRAASSPSLGTAAAFSILAGSEVTNTGASAVTGDIGISPGIGPGPYYVESGPRPGETGSAVIDGHVDWYAGQTGAFRDLRGAVPGDIVEVEDDAGATVSFVVRGSRTYDAAADATDVFVSTDGLAHLNLITCEGTWDRIAGQYSKRLVIFADAVAGE